ncbi:MAG: MaoC family dehydratase N-terminal domain-containing protein [Candidatus Thermoplasmatota archaeon]|nr:MaoC family dehydratase N-terminal domain-containing protein [Candidatus Thermoplasmatota archaeon]
MTVQERITDGRTITETDIVLFSYFTGDWTYLHTDREMAQNSIFGERVAHGYLTLSVSLGLMIRAGAIDTDVFMALKSIERVSFLKPVKIGDTLTVSYSAERRGSKSGSVVVTLSAKTFNQRKERVMEFVTVHIEKKR